VLVFLHDGEFAYNKFKIKFPSNVQAKVTTKAMQQSLPCKAICRLTVPYRVHKSAPMKNALKQDYCSPQSHSVFVMIIIIIIIIIIY
jgi:hypothetical protein